MITTSVRGSWPAKALATEIWTVPLPLPLAPLVIVIQEADVVAVQLQPWLVVTEMLKVPPGWSNVCDVGLMENVHPVAWVTVKVPFAIVSVPERAGPVLAATEKVTVPFPVPLEPDPIVIHAALLVAVHAQPAAAVTDTGVPLPPAATID